MKIVIIDTNIYINFYRLDNEQSIEMLKNLNRIIDGKIFRLVLPKQIEDEFIRIKNSKSAIHDQHILNFERGLEVQFKIPNLIKSNPKIGQIKNLIRRLSVLKKDLVKDYKNRVFKPNSGINKLLNKLFVSAYRPAETSDVLQKAWFRNLKGNPPKKGNSTFGDAIIWETILDQFSNDDVVLISGDGDFESEINAGDIHELLQSEWTAKTPKKLLLYTKLGQFINDNTKTSAKPIKEEAIKEEALLNSQNSFSTAGSQPWMLSDNASILGTSVYSVTSNRVGILSTTKCNCCGVDMGFDYGMLVNPRCENCKDYFSMALDCSKCKKHFHRGYSKISPVAFGAPRCDDCGLLS